MRLRSMMIKTLWFFLKLFKLIFNSVGTNYYIIHWILYTYDYIHYLIHFGIYFIGIICSHFKLIDITRLSF